MKNKSEKYNKGFTLLEMLVVTAIAAMILSFVMINIREAKMKSRDSRREEDIKQIQNALIIYVANWGLYPVCPSEVIIGGTGDNCIGPVLVAENAFQGGKPPADPLRGTTGTCGGSDSYAYCYQSDGHTYIVRYALETDTILGKSAGWQTASP